LAQAVSIVTILLGMAGALVGGFPFRLFGGTGATGFNLWSTLMATLGAVVLPFIHSIVARRTAQDGVGRARYPVLHGATNAATEEVS